MKNFFVIGDQTSKSLSPLIFNYWFKKYKINAKYGFLELNIKNFDKKIKEILRKKDVGGLNITIPFKQSIIKHLDGLDQHSKKINAVNCVAINKKVNGVNTDWEGYYKTLPALSNIKEKNILVIGYGGAALAIHYVLKLKGFQKITILNRTRKKLSFEKKTKYTLSAKTLNKYLPSADFIINTTPTNPINQKNLSLVNKKTILSDLVYIPKFTKFLKKFPGNKKIYGISMLVNQAALSFKAWFGFSPSIDTRLLKILDKKIK